MKMPTTNSISRDKTQIAYWEQGEGEQVLLFLHGLGQDSLSWRPQFDYFAENYRVVAVDCRGHGDSGSVGSGYGFSVAAEDVLAVLDHLGIHHCTLVGYSMGGMTSFELLLKAPHRFARAVLINTGPACPNNAVMRWFVISRLLRLWVFGRQSLLNKVAGNMFPEKMLEKCLAEYKRSFLKVRRWDYTRVLWAFLGWDVTSKLKDIQNPVLVVTADKDYSPVSYKQWYCQQLANGELKSY